MRLAFQVLGKSLRDTFDEFLLVLVCNVIWAALTFPLVMFALFALESGLSLVAALTLLSSILPSGPASAGLAYVAQRIADGRAASVADLFVGMRRYAVAGWKVMGIWVVGLMIIIIDIRFYAGIPNLFGSIVWGLWVYALILWVAFQIYLFPLVVLQEQPVLRTLARNTLLMTFGRPGFTLTTLALMSVLFAASFVLLVPLALITVGILAVWGMRATTALIEEDRRRRAAAEAAAAPPPPEEKGRRGQVRPK